MLKIKKKYTMAKAYEFVKDLEKPFFPVTVKPYPRPTLIVS